MGSGRVVDGVGGTSRGVMWLEWLLPVVLACTGMLVMPVGVGPIYAVVDICPGYC